MKKCLIKFSTIVLSLSLFAGLLPNTAFATVNGEEAVTPPLLTAEQTEEAAGNYGKRQVKPLGDFAVKDAAPKRKPLPAYYNSGSAGVWTPVRNQDPYGTCWAHGAIASCELYMIQHGIPVGKSGTAATNQLDLSESHLAWFSYTDAYDALGLLAGDQNICGSSLGFLDVGGNGFLASYTLMRWEGLADETTPALAYGNIRPSGLPASYAYQSNVAHVQDCVWISTADRDAVKAAIMEYGGGTLGYYHDDAYLSGAAYCYNGYSASNHDVTVVGWDDNYSRTNFQGAARPSSDGAWIIKNSWGPYYGDNGYLYISYEDTSANLDTCFFYAVESVDNYDYNYQYDGTGNFLNGWMIDNGESVANIFTANSAEQLSAVAFAAMDAGISYTLQIYTGVTSDPTAGKLAATQKGSFPYAGYHTVKLNKPVSLRAGEKFSVVFTLENPYNDYTVIPIDQSEDGNWIRWYHPTRWGTSYWWSAEGACWFDVSEGTNVRIKAYTECLHSSTEQTTVTAPTCTAQGVIRLTCSICGEDLSTQPISPLGHAFGAWSDIGEGRQSRVCSRCGLEETREEQKKCYVQSFSDCTERWYHEAVDYTVDNGLMGGTGKGRFAPYDTMTRAMMVTVLYRAVGEPPIAEPSTFSDVPTGQWYSDAIAWAQDYNIVGGVGHNRFAPDDPVTREQIAAILWRYMGAPTSTESLGAFKDAASVSPYAENAMRWAVEQKILNGDAGRLKPTDSALRSEFACMIMRFFKGSYACLELQ